MPFPPVKSLIGLALFLAAVGAYLYQSDFIRGAVLVPGTVVDLDCHEDDEGDTLCEPTYEYLTLTGERYEYSTGVSSNVYPEYGSPTGVYYDPSDPSSADSDGFFGIWFFPWLLFMAGAGVLAWGWAANVELPMDYASSVSPAGVLLAFVGAAVTVWAWIAASEVTGGLDATIMLAPAGALTVVLMFVYHTPWESELATRGAGLALGVTGLASVIGAYLLPAHLQAGFLLAVPFALLVTSALSLAALLAVQALVRDRRQRRRWLAEVRRAFAGDESRLVARVTSAGGDRVPLTVRTDAGDADCEAETALFTGLATDVVVRPGQWFLLSDPRWTERAVPGGAGYRETETERVLVSAASVEHLGQTLPSLDGGSARWPWPTIVGAAIPTVVLVAAVTWAWDTPAPREQHYGLAPPTRSVDLHGTVIAYEGAEKPAAQVGAICTVTLGPADSDTFNCIARVICDGEVLYGARPTGYTFCVVDTSGAAVTARDITARDGDAMLLVDVAAGSARIGRPDDWMATIALE